MAASCRGISRSISLRGWLHWPRETLACCIGFHGKFSVCRLCGLVRISRLLSHHRVCNIETNSQKEKVQKPTIKQNKKKLWNLWFSMFPRLCKNFHSVQLLLCVQKIFWRFSFLQLRLSPLISWPLFFIAHKNHYATIFQAINIAKKYIFDMFTAHMQIFGTSNFLLILAIVCRMHLNNTTFLLIRVLGYSSQRESVCLTRTSCSVLSCWQWEEFTCAAHPFLIGSRSPHLNNNEAHTTKSNIECV